MRQCIHPELRNLGIGKRVGWHTFRHTYSTLLKAVGTDVKVMQELLRHASIRVTLDTYTQALTPAKRAAQTAVLVTLGLDQGNGSADGRRVGEERGWWRRAKKWLHLDLFRPTFFRAERA